MINSDPPEHARRRGLLSPSFHPRHVEALRRAVEAAADGLLDAVVDRPEMDLIADYAHPLPMTIITAILGVPLGDGARIKAWADGVSSFVSSSHVSRTEAERYIESWGALAEYLRARLEDDRDPDAPDVLSELARRIEVGETTDDEAIANLVLLSVAGHETTTNSLGLAVLALLRHPAELERLRAEPGLADRAVEELLRFEPTASWDFRVAKEDVELDGRTIRRGQLVNFVLTAANRDPAAFTDPDRLDIARHPNRHVTFGQGAHFCLGSPLARLELQVGLATLLRRLASFELVDPEPRFKPNIRIRGLESLRLTFRPASGRSV
jgi:cytochrome P450